MLRRAAGCTFCAERRTVSQVGGWGGGWGGLEEGGSKLECAEEHPNSTVQTTQFPFLSWCLLLTETSYGLLGMDRRTDHKNTPHAHHTHTHHTYTP